MPTLPPLGAADGQASRRPLVLAMGKIAAQHWASCRQHATLAIVPTEVATMSKWSIPLAALLALSAAPAAHADPSAEALALYQRFAAAQNARDLSRVRPLLLDRPDLL